jgi:hypothetical protein
MSDSAQLPVPMKIGNLENVRLSQKNAERQHFSKSGLTQSKAILRYAHIHQLRYNIDFLNVIQTTPLSINSEKSNT